MENSLTQNFERKFANTSQKIIIFRIVNHALLFIVLFFRMSGRVEHCNSLCVRTTFGRFATSLNFRIRGSAARHQRKAFRSTSSYVLNYK